VGSSFSSIYYAGGPSLVDLLRGDKDLIDNPSIKEGLADMELLFNLLKSYRVLNKVCAFRFLSVFVGNVWTVLV
jgi:hypothetical protein